ncbi:MAG: FAD-binding oxidoreductase, partial [Pseudomonadota bacterium]
MTNTDKAPSQDVLSALAAIVGPKGVVAGDDRAPHLAEWRDKYKGETPLILAPASTEEVSRIVALCAEHGLAVTPQGGNTGLVGGQIPYKNEILVTLKRMIRIRGLAADGMSLAVDAGVTVEAAQSAAAEADRLFPLSLSSEGTAQIGGVVSTNAGGVNVLRYGNMRELVLGLEAVLPDGRIWNGMRALRKDNTGYDLKQLFIGAEGTLGLVTGAVLKLVPRPEDRAVAFVGLAAPAAALSLLARTQSASGGLVTSFELIPRIGIELDEKNIPGCRDPLSAPFPWYALIELAAGRGAGLRGVLEALLAEALDDGVIADAAIV